MSDDKTPLPEDAKYAPLPEVPNEYHGSHEVVRGNPLIDGPYLDEVRSFEKVAVAANRKKLLSEHKSDVLPKADTKKATKKSPAKKTAAKKVAAKKAVSK